MMSRRGVPVMSFGGPNTKRQMQAVNNTPQKIATDNEMAAFSTAFAHQCTYLVDDRFTVVVFGRTSPRKSGRLLKYVSERHLPDVCKTIRLASSVSFGHDRKSLGNDIQFGSPLWLHEKRHGDAREGMFTLTEDLVDQLCPGLKAKLDTQRLLHVFFNPGWIFCSALVPDQVTMDMVGSCFPGRDVVHIGEDPSSFAARIGIAFGRHQIDRITKGAKLYEMVLEEQVLKATRGAIAVFHGPVDYMEESHRNSYLTDLIASQGPLVALETQFTKREQFQNEHEYRFLVCGWGVPHAQDLMLPTDGVLLESFHDDGSFAPLPPPIHHLPGVGLIASTDREMLRGIPWRVARSVTVCAGIDRNMLFPLDTLSWLWGGTPMMGQPNEFVNELLRNLRST